MKKMALIIASMFVFSMPVFCETAIYQKVITTGDSVQTAMTKTRVWIARAFDYNTIPVSGQATVPVFLDVDTDGGAISVGGTVVISSMPGNGSFFNDYWNALLLFEFKEGKVRVSVPSLFGSGAPGSVATKYLDSNYDKAIKKVRTFLDSYETFLTTYSAEF